MNTKYCLATVTSKEFLKGSRVMITSFLRKNPWFDGDIVLISDEIKIMNKKTNFKNVKTFVPGEELIQKSCLLGKEVPLLKGVQKRFFIFEIFRLSGYDRVVYIDSDTLIRGDIRDLFFCREPLCASPDPAVYLNKVIEKTTFKRVSVEKNPDPSKYFTSPFSSGVLSVHQSLINAENYQMLIAKMRPDFFKNLADVIADGYILNHVFAGNMHLAGSEYNYVIHLDKPIEETKSLKLKDSLILHYTGPLKPWKVINQLKLLYRGKRYIKYLFIWDMEYFFSWLNNYI